MCRASIFAGISARATAVSGDCCNGAAPASSTAPAFTRCADAADGASFCTIIILPRSNSPTVLLGTASVSGDLGGKLIFNTGVAGVLLLAVFPVVFVV